MAHPGFPDFPHLSVTSNFLFALTMLTIFFYLLIQLIVKYWWDAC